LRIGTRASRLARWQADWVKAELQQRDVAVELVLVSTRGDRDQNQAIPALGGDGLFTKELERSLLADEIDLAVHSLKDLPTEPVQGLILAAVPARGPVGDVLVSRAGVALGNLRPGAIIGTGSMRRRAQLLHARPDLIMKDIRGNVDTRLGKLHAGEYDAIVLAEAGLARLGLEREITERLSPLLLSPAVGQGALGLECRASDKSSRDAVAPLDDVATHAAAVAERSMLHALAGGCLAPVAGWARIEADGTFRLTGVVLSADGRRRLVAERVGPVTDADALGQEVAADLSAQGAGELIAFARPL
jgi:hydroxymethylbilane synthase